MWPWYDKREKGIVNDILQMFGTHIKQLVFPGNGMAPSTAMKMLGHCCNVTQITLEICLNGAQVEKLVKKMKCLRKLEIGWMERTPGVPIIMACSKLKELVLMCRGSQRTYDHLDDWVHAGFKPPNLSVVNMWWPIEILQEWPQWNSRIPAGHTAHLHK